MSPIFTGKTPFAAIHFILPYRMILSAGGFMLGTGGSAYLSRLRIAVAREDGVAVYGVPMYVNMIFLSAFLGYLGYSMGTAPIVGYPYGAKHTDGLKSLFQKSFTRIAIFAASTGGSFRRTVCSALEALYRMTRSGFMIDSLSFLFAGFFTALRS